MLFMQQGYGLQGVLRLGYFHMRQPGKIQTAGAIWASRLLLHDIL